MKSLPTINIALLSPILFTCALLLLSTSVQAENQKPTQIPVQSIEQQIYNDFLNSFSKDSCKPGSFSLSCFDVDGATCVKHMQPHVEQCVDLVKRDRPDTNAMITCNSRQDCAQKAGNVGQTVGKRIGACAGAKYEQENFSHFKLDECMDFMRKINAYTPELEARYREVLKQSS